MVNLTIYTKAMMSKVSCICQLFGLISIALIIELVIAVELCIFFQTKNVYN